MLPIPVSYIYHVEHHTSTRKSVNPAFVACPGLWQLCLLHSLSHGSQVCRTLVNESSESLGMELSQATSVVGRGARCLGNYRPRG